jgi:hypothetical protein
MDTYMNITLRNYAIIKLKDISDTMELGEDEDLKFDTQLLEILLSLLEEKTTTVIIKCEITQILVNLSSISKQFTENFFDVTILDKLLTLTYSNDYLLVELALILLYNILIDLPNDFSAHIFERIPLLYRMKEILNTEKFIQIIEIKVSTIAMIRGIAQKIAKNKKQNFIVFVDIIPLLAKFFDYENCKNDEILNDILLTLVAITKDKNCCEMLYAYDVIRFIMAVVVGKKNERKFLLCSYKALGNLMYDTDQIVDCILENNFIEISEKLLNTYINSVNSNDKTILKDVIWCISNAAAGTQEQTDKVIRSNLLSIILQINKLKKDKSILLESLHVFYNALFRGSNSGILQLLTLNYIRMFCEAIKDYSDPSVLFIGLEGIISSFYVFQSMCNSDYHLRREVEAYCIRTKLSQLIFNENQQIAEKADKLLSFLEGSEKSKIDKIEVD